MFAVNIICNSNDKYFYCISYMVNNLLFTSMGVLLKFCILCEIDDYYVLLLSLEFTRVTREVLQVHIS